MSTRAVYTFIDDKNTFHIYKHHDGYPSDAYHAIAEATNRAWPLPRFEASEFAAAFVAENKDKPGGVYLTKHWDAHGDLAYRYEISKRDNEVFVIAYTADGIKIFSGNLPEFCLFIQRENR